jgi:hypothetical protein
MAQVYPAHERRRSRDEEIRGARAKAFEPGSLLKHLADRGAGFKFLKRKG